MSKQLLKKQILHPKDPGSAVTHFIGMVLITLAMFPLLIHTFYSSSHIKTSVVSMFIFCISMLLLYTASTSYHTFHLTKRINQRLKKCDHMMIFVMIAGSYTPICFIVLGNDTGRHLCLLVWTMALLGILLKAFWVYCPKWFSSLIYISMGWTCIFAMSQIANRLSTQALCYLVAGGIFYTIGGVIYALKLPIFNNRHKNFGSHEIFHIFVLLGSLCHYILMYAYVAHI